MSMNPKQTHTPWGLASHIVERPLGVIEVATPSHGGIGVPTELARAHIPEKFLKVPFVQSDAVYVWLEEDYPALFLATSVWLLAGVAGRFESLLP